MAARISGLDVAYDFGEGHPLLGRRMPDLDIVTSAGPSTVFAFMHDARPVLLSDEETNGSTNCVTPIASICVDHA